MRKRTGLANRHRSGLGQYSRKRKRDNADSYGAYQTGRMIKAERIAGVTISAQLKGSTK